MYKIKLILSVFMALLVLSACEELEMKPVSNDGKAPDSIVEPVVINRAGSVTLKYKLPNDPDLLYVKAEVEDKPGKVRVVKASKYVDSLTIGCFGESKEFTVNLYAVDRGENVSAPVSVKVHPQKTPIQSVFESLVVQPDFGGMKVNFTNEAEANIVVVVLTKNGNGDWVEADANYTKVKNGFFSVRGFAAEPREFGIYVRDPCNNKTEIAPYTLTPLFEEQIPKSNFKALLLPTDKVGPHANPNWTMDKIWDGITDATNGWHMHTKPGDGMPQQFTFDMGLTAQLSRMVYHMPPTGLYVTGAVKKFEVWGTNSLPNPDGSYDGWTLLLEGESVKPSGSSGVTEDDKAYALKGESFDLPANIPPVRYIRFKTLSTWGGNDYMFIKELTFFGQRR